jgi:hypothetical protein
VRALGAQLFGFLLECFELGRALRGDALGELQPSVQLSVLAEDLLRGGETGGHGATFYRVHHTFQHSLNSRHMGERHQFVRPGPNIVTVHQPAQLLTGHLDHFFFKQTGPMEPLPALNYLVVKTVAIAIPSQQLDCVESFADEEKKRRLKRILPHDLPNDGGKSVATTALMRCTA